MKNNEENQPGYIQETANSLKESKYFGRMNDPTASAYLTGPCGDSMEFYLVVDKGKITDIKYYTGGCGATRACAQMAAYLANDRTINEALCVSAGEIINRLEVLPDDHLHCAILAVSTLYRAIADYLLRP
ncbi:MAG TPA: iron-sulfur cluster assembly scaffold protein [Candidatus Wallbacteria bacterium]|nr:iron-sulfur cluster assembly scaffold protein [Candidatus Wallbacteria bacterium]